MNKDVIYIEPEDDITDIISRLKSSKQKVVALVPPKKLGVLRSAVNNKLIAKAAKSAEKVVVLVTADPSLTKIAISAGIPVAKTLQSRPTMPGDAPQVSEPEPEEVIEEPAEEPEPLRQSTTKATTQDEPDITLNSADVEKAAAEGTESPESSKQDQAKDTKKIPTFEKYRKWIIFGSVAGVALICFLVWALVFAPAANIVVAIKTTASNFSEDVSLVTTASSADVSVGRFALSKQESKDENSIEFEATGEKDVGEKASGTLSIAYYFGTGEDGKAISLPSGSTFSYNGLNYYSTSALSLSWDGDEDSCESGSSIKNGCRISSTVAIQAAESGASYNLDASRTDWSSSANPDLYITNPSAIAGGTSKVIKIVQASDVATAREKLAAQASDNSNLKAQLTGQFDSDTYVIDSSYSTSISDPVSSPAVGEEVESGKKAKLSTTTTATIYGVAKSAISDYITQVAGGRLSEDQKLYDLGEPFFERFSGEGNTFTAKLKTTTHSGPKVTDQEILEKSKGRKIGEVQTLLRSINGVSSVTVEKSVFWMGSVPDDENKITVEMTVEDQ